MNWTTGFEGFPGGNELASVMGLSLRNVKAETRIRLQYEHTFDMDTPPSMEHRLGLCSVVLMVDEEDTPVSKDVNGALQYKRKGGLYRDTGLLMELAGVGSHLGVQPADDIEVDHPSYVPRNPGAGYVEMTGNLDMQGLYKVTGLPTTIPVVESEALSRLSHLGDDPLGGAKHGNGCVGLTSFDIAFGLQNLKKTVRTKLMSGSGQHDVIFEDYSSWPIVLESSATVTKFEGHPTDPGDSEWAPRFHLTTDATVTLEYITLDP